MKGLVQSSAAAEVFDRAVPTWYSRILKRFRHRALLRWFLFWGWLYFFHHPKNEKPKRKVLVRGAISYTKGYEKDGIRPFHVWKLPQNRWNQ